MTIRLFEARALAPLVDFLEGNGARASKSLDQCRIPEELIETGGWITKKQAYDFAMETVRRTGNPGTVFSAYQNDFNLKHLGPIADAMSSCKTVKEAFDTAISLGSLAFEGSNYFLKIEGDVTWFCYQEPSVVSDGQTFINDMTLMVYFQFIRTFADNHWRPVRVRAQGTGFDRHHSLDLFEDCRTELHPEYSGLAFPTEFLSRRLPNKVAAGEQNKTRDWVTAPEDTDATVSTMYRLIASRFPHRKLPTLQQLALIVGGSPATLKRRLAASGTTYSKLLDRIRYEKAIEMLSMSAMSIREIAAELNYSGTNNFVRSFRRLTGVTPGQYRQQEERT